MTSKEVVTLDDALRFDGERCTETLKVAFDHVRMYDIRRKDDE